MGTSGSGKSTLAFKLTEFLSKEGFEVYNSDQDCYNSPINFSDSYTALVNESLKCKLIVNVITKQIVKERKL